MFQIGAAVLAKMIAAAFTQKFLMRMIVLFGDWLVKSTKNTLDDDAWKAYKESLNSQIGN